MSLIIPCVNLVLMQLWGGTNSQIKKWFLTGDKLVGEDGAIDGQPYCNEYGVIKKNSFTDIESLPTLFPWLVKDSLPCFLPFNPEVSTGAHNGKYVTYDEKKYKGR